MVCSKDEKNIKFTLVYSVFNIIPVLDQTGSGGHFWYSTWPTAMGGTDYNALGLWDNKEQLLNLSRNASQL